MAGPEAHRPPRHSLYSRTVTASLRLAVVAGVALGASGCAMSGSFGSLLGNNGGDGPRAYASEDATGSVAVRGAGPAASKAGMPSETDLVFTRLAIVDVLKRGGKETGAPWENPSSGARGTVTPIASAYDRDGMTCRDFLASYVRREGAETWLQGEACKGKKGAWQVRSLRPWTRS
ncbi:MAG TPA: RT0821/Lpp0805 family surface protein [Xanthobacteraceae bacterium]|nr:RT0821/Lpp0805 family surface protein [Xanthobacteraceae bacterium]